MYSVLVSVRSNIQIPLKMCVKFLFCFNCTPTTLLHVQPERKNKTFFLCNKSIFACLDISILFSICLSFYFVLILVLFDSTRKITVNLLSAHSSCCAICRSGTLKRSVHWPRQQLERNASKQRFWLISNETRSYQQMNSQLFFFFVIENSSKPNNAKNDLNKSHLWTYWSSLLRSTVPWLRSMTTFNFKCIFSSFVIITLSSNHLHFHC